MSIGITSVPGVKYNAGLAYVAIPADLDRVRYLRDCYNNNCISIRTEDGGFHNRVPVSPEVLNFIEFPLNVNELGSPVIYVTDELYQQLYIVSRLEKRDNLGDNKEHKFILRRKVDGGFVEISGSGESRTINLTIDGGNKDGELNINLFSANEGCALKIDVQGDVKVISSNNTELTQNKTFIVRTVSEDEQDEARLEQSTTEHKLYAQKVVVNDGEEAMILGNKFKNFMSDFIDELAQIKTTTAIGLQPIVNTVQVLNFKTRLDEFLSKEGFLKQ